MRRKCCAFLAVAFVLALAATGRADDAAARGIVEKGLKAMGGAENVAKYKAATFSAKGTFYGMGMAIAYTGTFATELPDRMHFTLDMEINGMKIMFVRAFDGTKGWMKVLDETTELTAEQITEGKHEMYAVRVTTLLPLVKDKDFQLAPLGETEVDKKPALGVKVSRKDQRDVNLFFDKESGLLVKSEYVVRDEESGKEVTQEEIMSDYKEFQGVKHPMKVIVRRDGKLYVDGETTEFKVMDKLDDGLFRKP